MYVTETVIKTPTTSWHVQEPTTLMIGSGENQKEVTDITVEADMKGVGHTRGTTEKLARNRQQVGQSADCQ